MLVGAAVSANLQPGREVRVWVVFLILFWLGLAVAVGILAANRGRTGIGWFLLAVVFSPLLAGIFVLVMRNLAVDARPSATFYDPATGKTELPPANRGGFATYYDPNTKTLSAPPDPNLKTCPDCGEKVQAVARICRFCRHEFEVAGG